MLCLLDLSILEPFGSANLTVLLALLDFFAFAFDMRFSRCALRRALRNAFALPQKIRLANLQNDT